MNREGRGSEENVKGIRIGISTYVSGKKQEIRILEIKIAQ